MDILMYLCLSTFIMDMAEQCNEVYDVSVGYINTLRFYPCVCVSVTEVGCSWGGTRL